MSKYFKTKNEFNNWIERFKKKQRGEDCFAQFSTQLTDDDYISGLIADGYTDLDNLVEDGHCYKIGCHSNNGWLYRDELYHFSNVPEERIRDRATIKGVRGKSGLSRAAFSRKYHIPVRTLEDWESEKRKCPEYLIELLDRAVTEDAITNFECYDPKILAEIGRLYRKLLFVLNEHGRNPYPLADAFPTKYFIMVFHKAIHVGIPKSLDNEIAHLFDAIDVEDWARSMTTPCPMQLRQYFVLAMTGYTGD